TTGTAVDHPRGELGGKLYRLQIAHQAVPDCGGELPQHRVPYRIGVPGIRVAHRVGSRAASSRHGRLQRGTEYRKKTWDLCSSRCRESAGAAVALVAAVAWRPAAGVAAFPRAGGRIAQGTRADRPLAGGILEGADLLTARATLEHMGSLPHDDLVEHAAEILLVGLAHQCGQQNRRCV